MTPETLTEADFVRLLTGHQRRLHRFIAVFLPSPVDAEDVLQETNAVLWKKAKQFTPGTNFLAWARAVARYEIIEYCRRDSFRGLTLAPDLLETVSKELVEEPADDRREVALRQCLGKLSPRNQKLIVERYDQSLPVKDIADRHNRPAGSVYRSLEQIRMALLECISRTLSAEEHRS